VFFKKDDVIIVVLRIHRTESVSAVFCPFYHLPSVERHCELPVPEKWTRVRYIILESTNSDYLRQAKLPALLITIVKKTLFL